jgi:hypothetical protein
MSSHPDYSLVNELMKLLMGDLASGAKLESHIKNHHSDLHEQLYSVCETHGTSCRSALVQFATDARKVPTSEQLTAAKKAAALIETLPEHLRILPKSRLGAWLGGFAAITPVAMYLTNRYGKSDNKPKESVASGVDIDTLKLNHAEDIAYTINHSLYCTLTDFLNPPINAATDGYLRWLIPGCGHDHSSDGGHHHAPANATHWEKTQHEFKHSFSKDRFAEYAKGEFIGDFGAVPLTIGIQRLFPDFMNGVRKVCEPVMRPVFNWGVARDTKKWAKENNIAIDSAEYKEHATKIYQYEMNHFPQAVVWTGFSLGLNTAYQMFADKSPMTFHHKFALKSTSVLSGVVVTAGVVVAARALAPQKMHSFDTWTGKNAILPATKTVGKWFGVKEEDVERMQQKHDALNSTAWTQRVESKPVQPALGL